jgi:pyruvate,water dikinase
MVLSLLRRLFGGNPAAGEARGEDSAHEAAFRVRLQERCERFRRLLSANKKALEAMSDIEERLAGDAPYGAGYLQTAAGKVMEPVQTMIRELNALSGNRYASLHDSFKRVSALMSEMTDVGKSDSEPARSPFVMPLAEIRLADLPRVGGKMANLGEMRAGLGLPVPEGFAVTASAYYAFMRHNNLYGAFARRIAATDMDNLDEVFRLSTDLQHSVLAAPLPPELDKAITAAVNAMKERAGGDLLLALRSSAVGEDSLGVTFAGQYRSELHVPPDEACDVWKEIVAGKYSVTAMIYRFQRGIPDDAAPMCVGVLSMIGARAGGVAYSRDPVAAAQGREQVLLNAVRGMPKAVVDGAATPDVFIFSRDNQPRLLEKLLADNTAPDETSAGAVSDSQARQIAGTALALESYYCEPQDVEWVFDANGLMVVLQTRPLREPACGASALEAGDERTLPSGLVVLAEGGVPVSPGVGSGSVFVGRKQADMLSFPVGGILVVRHAHPRWATLLSRAAGLVSETGGMAGHLASVAREYHLPALCGLKDACALLEGAGEVTLDADRAVVFAGRHPEIVSSVAKPANLMAGSPIQQRLQEIGRLVVPLHLLDPDSTGFSPENCRSLHDITRFCHEKAVRIMFDDGLGRRMGKQLKAGAKLQYWVVDMGGGFTKQVKGTVVDIAEIASAPMLALWDGITAVPWAGPPTAGAAGFMSVVFESAMNPELENAAPTVMADRNFFIISDRYMILQARYGYHLCTVECLADKDSHENFVSFQFKGGAADRERRRLRAAMIASLLEERGFRTDVKNDALFAVAEGFDAEATLRKIRLLGYLLIHTRQVDTIMRETGRAKALEQKLRADMIALAEKPLRFCGDSVS